MKLLKWILPLVAVIMVGSAVTSCTKESGDDKKTETNSIVGTWVCIDESDWTFTFMSNGSFREEDVDSVGDKEVCTGAYEYEDGVVTLYYNDAEGDVGVATISGNTMTYYGDIFKKK